MEYVSLLELLDNKSLDCQSIKGQYIQLLSYLTSTYDLTLDNFNNNIKEIFKMGLIIVCIIREKEGIILVGSGTIIIEPKIIHGGKSVGHIEDLVVHPRYRGKGVAQTILNMLFEYSNTNCYNVILNCNPNMEQFYKLITSFKILINIYIFN